jgi:hypothetical protein
VPRGPDPDWQVPHLRPFIHRPRLAHPAPLPGYAPQAADAFSRTIPANRAANAATTRVHPAVIAQAAATAGLRGPDPEPFVQVIRAYEEAGFGEVYLGQVGGRLDGAFEFFATQVLPRVREASHSYVEPLTRGKRGVTIVKPVVLAAGSEACQPGTP